MRWPGFGPVLALGLAVFLAGCPQSSNGAGGRSPVVSGGPAGSGVPPPPPTPAQSLGASSLPVIWVGGAVVVVTDQEIQLQEGSGSMVHLGRLARDATAFYRVAGDRWEKLTEPDATPGEQACVETLLDGSNFLAVRVFLGAGCGPA